MSILRTVHADYTSSVLCACEREREREREGGGGGGAVSLYVMCASVLA